MSSSPPRCPKCGRDLVLLWGLWVCPQTGCRANLVGRYPGVRAQDPEGRRARGGRRHKKERALRKHGLR